MRQVTLHIPEKKYSFFMELVKSLGFVKDIETDEEPIRNKQEILDGIKEAVEEVNDIIAGKKQGIPAKDLLNEL